MKVKIMPSTHDKNITADKVGFLPFDAETNKPVALADISGFNAWGKAEGAVDIRPMNAYRAAKLAQKLGDRTTKIVADALNFEPLATAFDATEEAVAADAAAACKLRNANRAEENRLDTLRANFSALDYIRTDYNGYLAIIFKTHNGEELTAEETEIIGEVRAKAEANGLKLAEAEAALFAAFDAVVEARAAKIATAKTVAKCRKAEAEANGKFVKTTRWGEVFA